MTGYQTGTGNELKNDGTWTYTYDAEGNMTEKSQGANATTWFYTFDSNNQMTTAQQYSKASGGTLQASVTYVYDALQNRIEADSWTQSSGTTTVIRFGYDGNQVWVDLNSSNQLQARYLHGDVIDQLFARINSGGTAAWYLADRLESIRGMVDNTGALQETVAYDGYGNITSDSNQSFGDRYKFTGRELDSVTGLQYNRARFYGAAVGRWVSEDPIGFKGGDLNLYRYVGNDATSRTDPTGLRVLKVKKLVWMREPGDLGPPIRYQWWGDPYFVWLADDATFVAETPKYENKIVDMTAAESAFFGSAVASKDKYGAEKQLVVIANAAQLARAFKWFDYCSRWTQAFWDQYGDPGLNLLKYQTYTVTWPYLSGPNHIITLVQVRGGSSIFGIDDGAVNNPWHTYGDDHIFDARQVADDESRPEAFRQSLKDAIDLFEHNPLPPGPRWYNIEGGTSYYHPPAAGNKWSYRPWWWPWD